MSETDQGLSPDQIARQIDASLKRLQTDYVDLYQAHRFDVTVPIEDTIEAFQQVVRQGKARYLGFSEWTPEQIQAAIDIAGPDLFASSQPQYSMLWQAPEAEVFPLCSANGISQIVWSPLAQGVLTGPGYCAAARWPRPSPVPPAPSRSTPTPGRRGWSSPPTCWPRSTRPSALRRSRPQPSRCWRRRESYTAEFG